MSKYNGEITRTHCKFISIRLVLKPRNNETEHSHASRSFSQSLRNLRTLVNILIETVKAVVSPTFLAMKLFHTLRHIFRKQFIYLLVPTQGFLLTWKNVFVLMMQGQLMVQTLAFFLFKSESNRERGDSYYVCSTAIACINHYLIYIERESDTLKLIDKFDGFIQNSAHFFKFHFKFSFH